MKLHYLGVAALACILASAPGVSQMPDTAHSISLSLEVPEQFQHHRLVHELTQNNMTILHETQSALIASPVDAPDLEIRIMFVAWSTKMDLVLSMTVARPRDAARGAVWVGVDAIDRKHKAWRRLEALATSLRSPPPGTPTRL